MNLREGVLLAFVGFIIASASILATQRVEHHRMMVAATDSFVRGACPKDLADCNLTIEVKYKDGSSSWPYVISHGAVFERNVNGLKQARTALLPSECTGINYDGGTCAIVTMVSPVTVTPE